MGDGSIDRAGPRLLKSYMANPHMDRGNLRVLAIYLGIASMDDQFVYHLHHEPVARPGQRWTAAMVRKLRTAVAAKVAELDVVGGTL